MPISENELMWYTPDMSKRQAEILEGPLVTAEVPSLTGDVQDEVLTDAAPLEPVVRVEGATRLEATLARLEMNSLDMKLYLDSIEQRIARIEPLLQGLPQGTMERLRGNIPRSGESREERWTHLLRPEVEEVIAAESVPIPEPTIHDALTRERDQPHMLSREGLHVVEPSAAPRAIPRDFAPAVAAVDLQQATEFRSKLPGVSSQGATSAVSLRSLGVAGAAAVAQGPALASAERAEAADGAATSLGSERPSTGPTTAYDRQISNPGEDVQSPRMWRGYRVLHLAIGLLLMVLAVIPAVIWWKTSTASAVGDGGDPTTSSTYDQRPTPASGSISPAKQSVAVAGRQRSSPAPGRGATEQSGDVAQVSQPALTGVPVVRRNSLAGSPASAGGANGATPLVTMRAGNGAAERGKDNGSARRTTSPSLGQGGAEVIGGTSAGRVRVASEVMAGHLLPVDGANDNDAESHERGEVVVALFISNTGRVEEVQPISGQPSLRGSAVRSIRNWRYEPYVQGGVRVPVVTTATIRFDGDPATP